MGRTHEPIPDDLLTDVEHVAKFMGYQTRMFKVYNDQPEERIWFLGEDLKEGYLRVVELRFDQSWDELMPVVERIGDLWIPTDQPGHQRGLNMRIHNVLKIGIGNHIQTVYREVLKFIKWHNAQTKSK
jgi:hypothetical protein